MGKKGKKKGAGDGDKEPGAAPQQAPSTSSAGAAPAAPPPVQQAPAQPRPPQRQAQQPAQRQQPRAAQPPSSGGGDKVVIQVPGNKVSLVIGAGGSVIKKIQSECQVKMWVDQESRDATATSKPLHISGIPKNVAEAQKRVMDIIGEEGGRAQGQQTHRAAQRPAPAQTTQAPPAAWGGQQQQAQRAAPAQPAARGGQQQQAQRAAPAQPAAWGGQQQQAQRAAPAQPTAWGGQQQQAQRAATHQTPQAPQTAERGGPATPQPGSGSGEPAQAAQGQRGGPPSRPSSSRGDGPRQQKPGPSAPPGFAPPQPVSAAGSKEPSIDRSSSSSPSVSSSSRSPSVGSVSGGISYLSLSSKGSDYKGLIPPRRDSRPKDPRLGKVIRVETNHLSLQLANPSKIVVCHYDVKVEPEKPYRMYRPAMEEMRRTHFPNNHPSFDGKKNLYSIKELPFGNTISDTVQVHDPERDQMKEVKVTITIASHVSMSSITEYLKNGSTVRPPQDAIQALDVVLRQPAARRFCQVGRSYFSRPGGEVISLGDGLDLWYGFFQSAIMGWKPFLNIDVAHKGFPSPVNCITALQQFGRGNTINPQDSVNEFALRKLRGLIKGLKVVYTVPPQNVQRRTYKVLDIGDIPRETRFSTQDRGDTNVEQYYLQQYNYRIKYPNIPCLKCGSLTNPISLPPELCTIMEGQVVLKKLNDEQTRNMVRAAATPADHRRRKIMETMRAVGFNQNECIREFGLTVGESFESVEARVLEAPTIEYGNNRNTNVRKGVWQSLSFIRPGNLENWVIYNGERRARPQEIDNLERELQRVGRELGMNVSPAQQRSLRSENPRDLEKDFAEFHKNKVQLLFVILPDRGNITYAVIKRTAEIHVGVLTQCLKYRTISRLSPATVTNILLKVNAKVNGINHYIGRAPGNGWPAFLKRPVMVVGADVTHPSPDQQSIPSVAAVAASHDARAFHYNMKWRLQPPREEMIRDLDAIMEEQLRMFHRRTNLKPEHILVYRDGVSEGQFATVLDIELQAIRRACSKIQPDYKPPITFLVVQKRHHTRFFPTRPQDEDGRNKNVPAGTIVDTMITHKTEVDFYLVSHASIQGTSRPTKYHLLWDDADMTEQSLEEITYYLCHLFTRCTRAVSYPAPTYYAHLAAFRIRSYIENERVRLDNLVREQTERTVKSEIMDQNPMFFV